jgi:hypothetical protein
MTVNFDWILDGFNFPCTIEILINDGVEDNYTLIFYPNKDVRISNFLQKREFTGTEDTCTKAILDYLKSRPVLPITAPTFDVIDGEEENFLFQKLIFSLVNVHISGAY